MAICKGIVKNNMVVLEDGVRLPDGAHVEVRFIEPSLTREQTFARVRRNRIPRYVGMDDMIEADKQDLLALPFVLFDVALAEGEDMELWTGNRRLYNALHDHLAFVQWIGDYQKKKCCPTYSGRNLPLILAGA